MKILSLGYLGFSSPKHLEWKQFGPEILGLGLAKDGADGSVRLRVDERHHRITIHPGTIDNVEYMGWELAGRREFEAALVHLAAKGYPATLATPAELENRRVLAMAWVVDPAGFRHEVYYGQDHNVVPFMPGRPIKGFVTGDCGLGHCVLVAPKITRELMDFATDVMGFSTYWTLGPIEIYRCNARSHCLIYFPMPDRWGMEHFYLDLYNMDDVGRCFDLCRDRNIIVKDFGRYAPDDDISFYVRSPSGVDIQYAYGRFLERPEVSWNLNQSILGMPPNSTVWGHKRLIPELGSMIRKVNDK